MSDDALRPRRTHDSNTVWRLAGGTEDNDLWAQNLPDGRVISTWVPTDEQRARIAAGANIDLCVWGGQPPVALFLDDYTPVGARPGAAEVTGQSCDD
jgi:hypothetical protein